MPERLDGVDQLVPRKRLCGEVIVSVARPVVGGKPQQVGSQS